MGNGFVPLVRFSNGEMDTGLRSISFDIFDQSSRLWLGRSVVGKWRCEGGPRCVQEEDKVVGLDICASKVGFAYCFLSLKTNVIRGCALMNSSGWFSKWFMNVQPWETSDLALPLSYRVCFKGVPFSYWHEAFLSFVGVVLGRFNETFNKINLSEAWIKVDIEKESKVLLSLQINLLERACMIEVEVLSSYKVSFSAFTRFSSSSCSSPW